MSVKITRKGNNLVYRGDGVSLDVDVSKVKDLHNVAVFLGSLDLPEDAKVRVVAAKKEKSSASTAEVEAVGSMGDDIVQLITSGVDTEEGIVAALQDKLLAAGKKSPRRSVNTGLRHAKNAGTIRELPDGKFAIGRR
jgi:hypothetical protein